MYNSSGFYSSNFYRKQYQCPQCGSQYSHKNHLQNHIKFECMKEPRFSCEQCGKRFKRKSDMRRHLRNIHKLDIPLVRKHFSHYRMNEYPLEYPVD